MAWNKQGGNDNNEGPWGDKGGGQNPWGGGGQKPPNLEEMIQRFQKKSKQLLPGGFNLGTLGIVLAVLVGIWLSTGFYRVNIGEQAAVLRFGQWVDTTNSGLRYHLPYPFEQIIIKKVAEVRSINSGTSPIEVVLENLRASEDQPLMLTGDENIVDATFTVQWYINDLGKYLFRARNPDETVKIAAESIVREIIAQTTLDDAITKGRGEIDRMAQQLLQKLVNEYELGIEIRAVQFQKVDAPPSVIESFRDVQRAKADQKRIMNEAEVYQNSVIPIAEGDAIKIDQDAKAYKATEIARAKGDAGRFELVLTQFRQARDVTTKRIYLETVSAILQKANKVFLDKSAKGTQGILPHLALPAIKSLPSKNQEKS